MSVWLEWTSVIRTATIPLAPTLAAVMLAIPSTLTDSDVMVHCHYYQVIEQSEIRIVAFQMLTSVWKVV